MCNSFIHSRLEDTFSQRNESFTIQTSRSRARMHFQGHQPTYILARRVRACCLARALARTDNTQFCRVRRGSRTDASYRKRRANPLGDVYLNQSTVHWLTQQLVNKKVDWGAYSFAVLNLLEFNWTEFKNQFEPNSSIEFVAKKEYKSSKFFPLLVVPCLDPRVI